MEDNTYAESLKKTLSSLNNERMVIERKINDIKNLIDVACKHTNCVQEYDDDFHRPGFYNRCLTCGYEFKKR
jgi:hypothetical protein